MWLECVPLIEKCTCDVADFIHILEKLMERLDANQMHIVAMVARQIWLRRNVVIFGGEFLGPSSLIRRAMEQIDACDEVVIKGGVLGKRFIGLFLELHGRT